MPAWRGCNVEPVTCHFRQSDFFFSELNGEHEVLCSTICGQIARLHIPKKCLYHQYDTYIRGHRSKICQGMHLLTVRYACIIYLSSKPVVTPLASTLVLTLSPFFFFPFCLQTLPAEHPTLETARSSSSSSSRSAAPSSSSPSPSSSRTPSPVSFPRGHLAPPPLQQPPQQRQQQHHHHQQPFPSSSSSSSPSTSTATSNFASSPDRGGGGAGKRSWTPHAAADERGASEGSPARGGGPGPGPSPGVGKWDEEAQESASGSVGKQILQRYLKHLYPKVCGLRYFGLCCAMLCGLDRTLLV